MALDYQAIGVAVGGLLTIAGTIFTGYQTGRSGREKDRQNYAAQVEQFKVNREAAEELASKARVEALAADAELARARLRETEAALHTEAAKRYAEIRDLQIDRQRGWDLARSHFGLLTVIVHIVNSLFQVMEMAGEDKDRVLNSLRNAHTRISDLRIPTNVEEPIPGTRKKP